MAVSGEAEEQAARVDPCALAADWITIVQSELAGLAADREAQEMAQAMVGIWARAATTMLHAVARDRPATRAAAPPRPAPAAAASDAGRAEIDELRRRIRELEARLDALQPSDGGDAGPG